MSLFVKENIDKIKKEELFNEFKRKRNVPFKPYHWLGQERAKDYQGQNQNNQLRQDVQDRIKIHQVEKDKKSCPGHECNFTYFSVKKMQAERTAIDKHTVPADDLSALPGSVNYAESLNEMGKSDEPLLKYAVLRGFSLFYYDKLDDRQPKHVIPITSRKLESQPSGYFELAINETKHVKILLDILGNKWLQLLRNQAAYHEYLVLRDSHRVNLDLQDYFQNSHADTLRFAQTKQDLYMGDLSLSPFMHLLVDSMPFHARLAHLDLSHHCPDPQHLQILMEGLALHDVQLRSLLLSHNQLSEPSLLILNAYLTHPASYHLHTLVLDHNPLENHGVAALAQALVAHSEGIS